MCSRAGVREAHAGTHKTSSTRVAVAYLLGVSLVPVRSWKTCLGTGAVIKWIVAGLCLCSMNLQLYVISKSMCFLNRPRDCGCKDCGSD